MDDVKRKASGIAGEVIGIAKRALGELTARPDFVLEGEKQQAECRAQVAAAKQDEKIVIGWLLDPERRRQLLAVFPPRYENVVAHHVTLASGQTGDTPLPADRAGHVVGHVDDGESVEALVVAVEGATDRPDGSTYHVTWSLAPGRRAVESNDVIAKLGWDPLVAPQSLQLTAARLR
ncbi:CsbD family protein [Novosphingobium sp. AP12]|uniref:CsbD family protein n=1 Tax=Novosphingobium sp. AP12 TaxID=1144305 RepID=UPI000271E793|nr:CsbD family protein [Novosphingobium sp. AP12]EJL24500.1 hypothetical protein PMI02_03626 [Novosphingobium sp. AP12]